MTDFSIGYDMWSSEVSSSGSVWGPIWIEADGDQFPEDRWDDMPVALLVEFARAASILRVGSSETVRFFDGPFSVIFRQSDLDNVDILMDGAKRRPDISTTVDRGEWLAAIHRAGRDMYRDCLQLGWSEESDVRRLGMSMDSLNPGR
jgi:hypothetical protein